MDADIKGSLDNINRSYRVFEYKGKPMTKAQVIKVLTTGLMMGYKSTSEFKDGEIDKILTRRENS